MAIFSTLLAVGAGIAKGVSSLQAGRDAQAQQRENEIAARRQIRDLKRQTAEELRRQNVFGRKFLQQNRASVAASGITQSGSALEILRENAANITRDAQQIKIQSKARQTEIREELARGRTQASRASFNAGVGAASSLLDTGVSLFGEFGG